MVNSSPLQSTIHSQSNPLHCLARSPFQSTMHSSQWCSIIHGPHSIVHSSLWFTSWPTIYSSPRSTAVHGSFQSTVQSSPLHIPAIFHSKWSTPLQGPVHSRYSSHLSAVIPRSILLNASIQSTGILFLLPWHATVFGPIHGLFKSILVHSAYSRVYSKLQYIVF